MKPAINTKEKTAISLAKIPIISSKPIISSIKGSQEKTASVKTGAKKSGKGLKIVVKDSA